MKVIIAYVSAFCVLLIVGTTAIFKEKLDRIKSYGSSISINSLAISMEGINTHEFNRQHQPYLDYLSQK